MEEVETETMPALCRGDLTAGQVAWGREGGQGLPCFSFFLALNVFLLNCTDFHRFLETACKSHCPCDTEQSRWGGGVRIRSEARQIQERHTVGFGISKMWVETVVYCKNDLSRGRVSFSPPDLNLGWFWAWVWPVESSKCNASGRSKVYARSDLSSLVMQKALRLPGEWDWATLWIMGSHMNGNPGPPANWPNSWPSSWLQRHEWGPVEITWAQSKSLTYRCMN